jgi:thioredoxin 1
MVLDIPTDEDFQRLVYESKGYVLVDYHAKWCGPCKLIAPRIHSLSQEWKEVSFYKVDVDVLRDISEKEEIECMPTFVLYLDGKEQQRATGADLVKIYNLLNLTK